MSAPNYADLTLMQRRILQFLAQAEGWSTRQDMYQFVGATRGYSAALGAPTKRIHANSLEALGLVERRGDTRFMYRIAPAGRALVANALPDASSVAGRAQWLANTKAWIFQGNPKKFDVDDYLARYPQLIYWRIPRYQAEVAVGDRAFIWRAGPESGVVASGIVVEAPVRAEEVLHPEALGNDLWFAEKPDDDEPKVGIALDSVRLSLPEGMLPRTVVKNDPLLKQGTIIRMSNGTVFHLSSIELNRIEELWAGLGGVETEETSADEGRLQVKAHRRRERSRFLVRKKLEEFRRIYGSLYCEVCALPERGRYPEALAPSVFEVHHTSPLASAASPRRTTLADLAVVCASCHRAIHATSDVDENMQAIKEALKGA